ncbi:MAG: flagellar motor switch protein FliG [Treponemataceae bacterium]|nr:flagellar motor switch protein FliG [Treponemataceae bacterium]
MNLNDVRANAYQQASKAGGSSGGGPQTPQSQFQSQSQSTQKTSAFQNGGRQAGGILPRGSADSGGAPRQNPPAADGLLKVPAAGPQGGDAVYRRVAKFLLLIGVDEAAKILPHLSAEQTERIIPEIASIRSVSPEEASVILAEFQTLLERSRESGGVDTARTILEKAYGSDRAREILDKVAPLAGAKPFDYLNDADSGRIFSLLGGENGGVRALVLSHLEPKKAAAVINLMEPEDKMDVVRRLAAMQPVPPDVLRRVDQAMHEKSLMQTSEAAENIDGRNALAAILKKMPPEAEDGILSSLSEEDPELGQDLRSRLFTMEDVVRSDDRFIQEQLRSMTDGDIARLVAGKPDEFQEKILGCISAGRRALVLEEAELNKPLLRTDCERVTRQFFSVLRRAYEQGRLIIDGRSDDIYV